MAKKKAAKKTPAKAAKKMMKKTASRKTAAKASKKSAPKAAKKVSFVPKGYTSVTPYLVCRAADQAIEFYKKAFGAKEKTRMLGPDGKIMHAEITIAGAHIMLGEESADMGALSPLSIGGSGSGVMLYLQNVDQVFASAIAAGATVEMPLGDQFWGDRYGKLADPFGHKWSLAKHIEDMSTKEMARRGDAFFKQFAEQAGQQQQ